MNNKYEKQINELNKNKKILKMEEKKYNDKWSKYVIPLIICACWFLFIKEILLINTSLLFNIFSVLVLGVPSILIVKKKRKKMLNRIKQLNKEIDSIQKEITIYDNNMIFNKENNNNFDNSKYVHLEKYETHTKNDSLLQYFFVIDRTYEENNLDVKVRKRTINNIKK